MVYLMIKFTKHKIFFDIISCTHFQKISLRSFIHDLSYSLQNNQRSNSKFAQLHFFAIMKDKIDKTCISASEISFKWLNRFWQDTDVKKEKIYLNNHNFTKKCYCHSIHPKALKSAKQKQQSTPEQILNLTSDCFGGCGWGHE